MPDDIELTVVIPTRRREQVLERTLDQLARQETGVRWEVVVVNNDGGPDTDRVVAATPFTVPVRIVHESRPGAASARNAGAEAARGRLLLFLDDDILVEPDFLERHLAVHRANPGVWVVGQLANLPEQERTPFGRFRRTLFASHPLNAAPTPAEGLTGQNLSLPRSDFEALQGFDSRYRIASVEDLDLGIRARRMGIRILYVAGAHGIHNDWAGFTIRDYCERQRSYTRSEPLLARAWGDAPPRPDIVAENGPIQWGREPSRVSLRKAVKACVATTPVREGLYLLATALERIPPAQPLLWRIYRTLLAGAIYRGYREGLQSLTATTEFGRAEPVTHA